MAGKRPAASTPQGGGDKEDGARSSGLTLGSGGGLNSSGGNGSGRRDSRSSGGQGSRPRRDSRVSSARSSVASSRASSAGVDSPNALGSGDEGEAALQSAGMSPRGDPVVARKRHIVNLVVVDAKARFGAMSQAQQQLPKKTYIYKSVPVKEGDLKKERSRDVVRCVLGALPQGQLTENDVARLACTSLKKGDVISALDAIETDSSSDEGSPSSWGDVSAFFVSRHGSEEERIHLLEDLVRRERDNEGWGGPNGRPGFGEVEKEKQKSLSMAATETLRSVNLADHHKRWGGGDSGKVGYGDSIDGVFAPQEPSSSVSGMVSYFPETTFDEAEVDDLEGGGTLSTAPCRICGWRRRLAVEDAKKQGKRRSGWECGNYGLSCETQDRVCSTTLFLRVVKKAEKAEKVVKRKAPAAKDRPAKAPKARKPRQLSVGWCRLCSSLTREAPLTSSFSLARRVLWRLSWWRRRSWMSGRRELQSPRGSSNGATRK